MLNVLKKIFGLILLQVFLMNTKIIPLGQFSLKRQQFLRQKNGEDHKPEIGPRYIHHLIVPKQVGWSV